MSFPSHLLDELARAFALAAVDRALEESAAREPRQEQETQAAAPEPQPSGP